MDEQEQRKAKWLRRIAHEIRGRGTKAVIGKDHHGNPALRIDGQQFTSYEPKIQIINNDDAIFRLTGGYGRKDPEFKRRRDGAYNWKRLTDNLIESAAFRKRNAEARDNLEKNRQFVAGLYDGVEEPRWGPFRAIGATTYKTTLSVEFKKLFPKKNARKIKRLLERLDELCGR